jgi:hypothetical protein
MGTKRSIVILLLLFVLPILVLTGCSPENAADLLDELNEPEAPELKQRELDPEDYREADAQAIGGVYAFKLSIHRIMHITDPGVNTVIEEDSIVEVRGE